MEWYNDDTEEEKTKNHFQTTIVFFLILIMLIPVFSLQLNTKVQPRTLAVGKFNGKRSCLVGATAGNKVERERETVLMIGSND